MKFSVKLLFTSAVVLGAFSMTAGCKKSNGSNAQFTATINNTAWASNISETGILASGIFGLGGIQYKNGDSTEITLVFSQYAQFSQPMSSTDSADRIDIGYIDLKTRTAYDGGLLAGHSTITITNYDSLAGTISGTFTGVVYNISGGSDSVSISNGIFNTNFAAN